MSTVAFAVIAILTLAAALAAATLQKLMHAALSLRLMFVASPRFLLLGAEFVGLVQIFVYIGAVAVLIVFTILLTRDDTGKVRSFNWGGVIVAIAVFVGIGLGDCENEIASANAVADRANHRPANRRIADDQLCLAAPVRGVLLTAALIGALILVMEEKS